MTQRGLTHNPLCGIGRAPQRKVSDPQKSALSRSGRMRCSKCGCQEDKVIDSRTSREGATIRRRRECLSCGHRFTTYEEIENEGMMVVKRDDRREPFSRDKLLLSLRTASQKRPVKPETLQQL